MTEKNKAFSKRTRSKGRVFRFGKNERMSTEETVATNHCQCDVYVTMYKNHWCFVFHCLGSNEYWQHQLQRALDDYYGVRYIYYRVWSLWPIAYYVGSWRGNPHQRIPRLAQLVPRRFNTWFLNCQTFVKAGLRALRLRDLPWYGETDLVMTCFAIFLISLMVLVAGKQWFARTHHHWWGYLLWWSAYNAMLICSVLICTDLWLFQRRRGNDRSIANQ